MGSGRHGFFAVPFLSLWNTLEREIRMAPTLLAFHKLLKIGSVLMPAAPSVCREPFLGYFYIIVIVFYFISNFVSHLESLEGMVIELINKNKNKYFNNILSMW